MKYTRLFCWRLNGVIGLRAASQKQTAEEDWRGCMLAEKDVGHATAGYSTGFRRPTTCRNTRAWVNVNLSVS
ncbi:hypothetical protein [Pectobacterium versatile]|uniref:hypothetical protein n=1 Tax=Pectobacterium versatile TaxID=2488639 RepID=UPI001968B4DD|nr:hypothetical protein [Pectobacterium versatile]MBN3236927.1 hypothetical protein [Pectobacterium versatile]